MTNKPIGVFVRLPLDEAQIMKLYNPKKSGNENLLAIGTPVTGGELDTSRECFEQFYAQMCTEATGCAGVTPDYVRGLRSGDSYGPRLFLNNIWEAWPNFATFALAKLAEKDVEIARLQDNLARTLEIATSRADGTTCTHLVRQAFSLAKTTGMSADDVVQTVLGDLFPIMKGSEA